MARIASTVREIWDDGRGSRRQIGRFCSLQNRMSLAEELMALWRHGHFSTNPAHLPNDPLTNQKRDERASRNGQRAGAANSDH